MNLILLMHGYPIIRKRDHLAYISSLEKAQLGGSNSEYLKLIYKAVDRSLDIYLNAVEGKNEAQEVALVLLKIGQLAKEVNENTSTILHWTKKGLRITKMTNAQSQKKSHRIPALRHPALDTGSSDVLKTAAQSAPLNND